MGFGAVEAMVVMEELGRGIVVEPYAAVALVAAPLLVASGRRADRGAVVPGIADGSAIVVLAHQERRARYRLAHVETKAVEVAPGKWQVSGAKSIVPAGAHAAGFIVPARVKGAVDDPAGIALFAVVPGPGVTVRGYPTQDGACAAEMQFDQARRDHARRPGGRMPSARSRRRSTAASRRRPPRRWA